MACMLNPNKTNTQLSTLKWLGILTMTIDHIGALLFPEVLLFRIIGRLALPCFLIGVYEGTHRTRHYGKYLGRILALGILSMAVTVEPINVLFLFALFSVSIRHRKLFLPALLISYFTEYGIYGFLLGWTIVWLKEKSITEGTLMSILLTPLSGNPFQVLSGMVLPVLTRDWGWRLPRGPRLFFYVYYPLHLVVLRLIAHMMH